MKTNGISTRKRNIMSAYVGKTYMGGVWESVTIKCIMADGGGYFVTIINDGGETWESNASLGEIRKGIETGELIEA